MISASLTNRASSSSSPERINSLRATDRFSRRSVASRIRPSPPRANSRRTVYRSPSGNVQELNPHRELAPPSSERENEFRDEKSRLTRALVRKGRDGRKRAELRIQPPRVRDGGQNLLRTPRKSERIARGSERGAHPVTKFPANPLPQSGPLDQLGGAEDGSGCAPTADLGNCHLRVPGRLPCRGRRTPQTTRAFEPTDWKSDALSSTSVVTVRIRYV